MTLGCCEVRIELFHRNGKRRLVLEFKTDVVGGFTLLVLPRIDGRLCSALGFVNKRVGLCFILRINRLGLFTSLL
jgi:hypothetical protein